MQQALQKGFCHILCKSTLNIGNVGEMAALHRIVLAQKKYYPNIVAPMISPVEGAPFDSGLIVNKQFFKLQIKTTEHVSDTGRMTFLTCHSSTGKPYSDTEVDLFLLHCIDSEWYGLALPSECGKITYIYQQPTTRRSSYQATWFDFDKRVREIIETGEIQPVPFVADDKEDVAVPITDSSSFFKKPSSWGELYNLLAYYSFDLNAFSDDINVSVPTLQRWIEELSEQDDNIMPQ